MMQLCTDSQLVYTFVLQHYTDSYLAVYTTVIKDGKIELQT
jgi:hypothetical protein